MEPQLYTMNSSILQVRTVDFPGAQRSWLSPAQCPGRQSSPASNGGGVPCGLLTCQRRPMCQVEAGARLPLRPCRLCLPAQPIARACVREAGQNG